MTTRRPNPMGIPFAWLACLTGALTIACAAPVSLASSVTGALSRTGFSVDVLASAGLNAQSCAAVVASAEGNDLAAKLATLEQAEQAAELADAQLRQCRAEIIAFGETEDRSQALAAATISHAAAHASLEQAVQSFRQTIVDSIETVAGSEISSRVALSIINAHREVPTAFRQLALTSEEWELLESALQMQSAGVSLTASESAILATKQQSTSVIMAQNNLVLNQMGVVQWFNGE